MWDDENGVKVSENAYNKLASPASFEISTEGLVPQRDYVIKIDPLTGENTPILNEKGEPLSLAHKMRYDPTIKQTGINIASVAIEDTQLVAKLETINGDQVATFDGWLINEDTNAQVPKSEFSAGKLSPGSTLRIPMGDIGEGKYRVIVKAMGKDGLILSQSEYEGVVYVPPAKPSGLSVLVGKITAGLKANPWILIAIIVLVVGVIGVLIIISVKRRETGTPVLQGSMEVMLGKPSSNLPINQTVYLEKPAAQATQPSRPARNANGDVKGHELSRSHLPRAILS